MAIERIPGGGMVITGESIGVARLLTLRGALSLECKGLKRRGRSVHSIVKAEFGLKGNKTSVLKQFESLLREKGVLR